MAANSVLDSLIEGFQYSPELDEPTTKNGNEEHPPPIHSDDSFPVDRFFNNLPTHVNLAIRGPSDRPSTNWFLRKLSLVLACQGPYAADDISHRDLPNQIPPAGSVDRFFNHMPTHVDLAIRGLSDRPSTNWFLRKLSLAFPSQGPYAGDYIAHRGLSSLDRGLNCSSNGNIVSASANDTIIGSHHWVPENSQAHQTAGFQSLMEPSFIGSITESYPPEAVNPMVVTSQPLYNHGACNDLTPYLDSLPVDPVSSGSMNYNTHVPLNQTSAPLFGDWFNALEPNHHVPPIEYPGQGIDMCIREISSTGPSQRDLHESSLRPSKSMKRDTHESSNGRKESCKFCRLKKVPCMGKSSTLAIEMPCERCLKIARDVSLALRFCEYDFNAFNVRRGIVDFYDLRERGLSFISVTQDLPTRSIILAHPLQRFGDKVINVPGAPTLKLICHEDDGPADFGWIGPEETQNLQRRLSNFMISELTIHEKLQPVLRIVLELLASQGTRQKSYVFLKDSLPDRESLVEWGKFDIMMLHNIAPGDVETALTAFLTAYVERKGMDAPHADLAKMTLDLVSLSRLLDSRRPVQQEEHLKVLSSLFPRDKGRARAFQGSISVQDFNSWKNSAGLSGRARSQLFAHVVKWIEPLEESITRTIDEHITRREKKRTWEGDPMILGFVARRMCLYYRRNMIRYKQFGEKIASRSQNNKDMLDIMTCHYGYIFTGALSPFHDDWDAETHESILGNDPVLLKLLDDLKTAEKYHYLNELGNDFDTAYKRLVTEHVPKKQSTLVTQWKKGSDPSLLSNDLDSIRDQQAFDFWSLVPDEGGQSGLPDSIHTGNFPKESENPHSDQVPSGSSVPPCVQNCQSGIQQSQQPTQEPPQRPQEGSTAMNSDECQDAPTSQTGTSKPRSKQEPRGMTESHASGILNFGLRLLLDPDHGKKMRDLNLGMETLLGSLLIAIMKLSAIMKQKDEDSQSDKG